MQTSRVQPSFDADAAESRGIAALSSAVGLLEGMLGDTSSSGATAAEDFTSGTSSAPATSSSHGSLAVGEGGCGEEGAPLGELNSALPVNMNEYFSL